jgi:hypothetical protein
MKKIDRHKQNKINDESKNRSNLQNILMHPHKDTKKILLEEWMSKKDRGKSLEKYVTSMLLDKQKPSKLKWHKKVWKSKKIFFFFTQQESNSQRNRKLNSQMY